MGTALVLAIILIIIILILIIVVILINRYRPSSISRQLSTPIPPQLSAPTFTTPQQLSTVYTSLTSLIGNTLIATKDVPFPSTWPVSGTTNNINLRDEVVGSGTEAIDVVVNTLNLRYTYKVASISGLADALRISNLTATFDPPVSGSQKITITADLSADRVDATAAITASGYSIFTVRANCPNIRAFLTGVRGKMTLEIITENCSTITSAHLTELTLSFASLSTPCPINVSVPSLTIGEPNLEFTFDLNNFRGVAGAVAGALPKLRPVLDRIINRALTGQSIGLCVFLPPPPTCLLGTEVIGASGFTIKREVAGIGYEACKALCTGHQSCNYVEWLQASDTCILISRLAPSVVITDRPGGNSWEKATGRVFNMPFNTAGQVDDEVPSPIPSTSAAVCEKICAGVTGCRGYRSSGGACHLYPRDGLGLQRATLDIGTCSRNLDTPYTFS